MEFAPFIPIALLALGGIGYLIKRRVEGKRESEVVDNAHKWARLYREVHDRPPSLEDIIRLRQSSWRRSGVHPTLRVSSGSW